MLEGFIRHIREKNILDVERQYLLAASGGLDSTVLAHLLCQAGVTFSIAHCNFGLRGQESNGDEQFVSALAEQLGMKLHLKFFDTKAYAAEKSLSTQMAARELRYQWFDELLEQYGYAGLIVAHHADDQIETVLLNLLRGTGIEGVYGMSESRGNIIRPLLPFTREDIAAFASSEGITWREDSSNATIDYKRNFLRHQVIPQLRDFGPAALQLLQYSFDRIKDTGKAFFYLYDSWLEKNIQREGEFQSLELATLAKAPGRKSLLFYWLRSYGFSYFQMEDVLVAMHNRLSGKIFLSPEFTLNMDRDHLILGPRQVDFEEIWIDKFAIGFTAGNDSYDVLLMLPPFNPPHSSAEAMLDRDKLVFPLKLRKWEQGDRFRPLGMKHFKKVSDLLVDMKVPLIHKNNIKVLCSGEDIVWVLGLRIDDRYKLTAATQSALYFKKSKSDKRRSAN